MRRWHRLAEWIRGYRSVGDGLSPAVIQDTHATTQRYQQESTKRLRERLHDINFWKQELERQIYDIDCETSRLVKEKHRMELALQQTDYPLHIVTENLNARSHRRGVDKVEDSVQVELKLELNLIRNVQDILKKTIGQAENQIRQNRVAKENLELNWSDKLEAGECDATAGHLHNGSTNKQFYPGVALYQEHMSSPESWTNAANEVVSQSEKERLASIELRNIMAKLLNETSRDLMQQHDRVCSAFKQNLDRLLAAKAHLENHLRETAKEITSQENNIAALKEAIRAKDDPVKVAQTRLHLRQFRPNLELCKDPAAESLACEVNLLTKSLDLLFGELTKSEEKLRNLQDLQMNLEKEIDLKKETIRIDEVQCLPRRAHYPSAIRLQGYP
ncbi:tektin-4 [Clonorchis sinensis]|uniref:Tektin n=1 Tax=Clonorchis sinensis TaxID=79923 RepID=H2KSC6_CLOSI|nr:tektin-4 [Clonorchis sinensis]